jgi:competence protein ComEA
MLKFLFLFFFVISNLFSINLQTASKDELMSLKGVGPVIAGRILEYRKRNSLANIDDLINIRGIGSGKLSKIKAQLGSNSGTSNKKIDLNKYK